MSLRHRKEVSKADGSDTSKVRASDWGSTSTDYDTLPTHVFSGGAAGSLLYRDTGAIDGMSWLPSAQGVLAASGAGVAPAFTMTPSLTSLQLATALPPASGGTGLASYTIGDLLYASAPTTLSKLADVAVGSVLASGGVGAAPAWTSTPTLTGTNFTGIPIAGLTGLGTGVATALAVNVGSAGAFVAFNGALGTPSSGTLTNASGLPIGGLTGLGSGVAAWLATPSSANLATAVSDETGSGALVFADSPSLTTLVTLTRSGIGVAATDGVIIQNATAAAAGAQQASPLLRLTGQGWKTDATAASQQVDWALQTLPVQGTTEPSANFLIRARINGGAYATRLTLASGGQLTTSGILNGPDSDSIGVDLMGFYVMRSGGYFRCTSRFEILGGGSTGQLVFRNAAQNAGIGWDFATDAIAKLRTRALSGGAALNFLEQTAPSAPAANEVVLYAQDNGGGKTQLMALFASGAAQQVAIQP